MMDYTPNFKKEQSENRDKIADSCLAELTFILPIEKFKLP